MSCNEDNKTRMGLVLEDLQEVGRHYKETSSLIFENLPEKWLSTKEAANYLRVSPKRLLNLSSNGKIPYYKLGRCNRYLESELKKLLLAEPRGGFHGNKI